MEVIEVKEVDENLLEQIKDIIVSSINPRKIILFGSYAYGKPHKGSDIDILVIVDQLHGSRREMRIKIRRLLRKYLIAKDIIIATVKDLEEWENVPQAFLTQIIEKGRVLYER
jgi:predicted nucleotidyltransferase